MFGAGDALDIVKGDAYFQSYICHPSERDRDGLDGRFAAFSGFLFPSICDVIRNLSGMWKMNFPHQYVKYLDFPQNFDPAVGGRFYRSEIEDVMENLARISGRQTTDGELHAAIALYNQNRDLVDRLYDARRDDVLVLTVVGAVVMAVLFMFLGFGGSGKKEVEKQVEPEVKAEVPEESDMYKARLAVADQKQDQRLVDESASTPGAQLEQASKKKPVKRETRASRRQRPTRIEQSEQPEPRRVRTLRSQPEPSRPARTIRVSFQLFQTRSLLFPCL